MNKSRSACVAECRRQQVGLDRLADLLEGYNYAVEHSDRLPNEGDLLHLAGVIEPSSLGRYRQTPVTFQCGGASVTPSMTSSATARMMAHYEEGDDPKEFVHNLLKIHPFTDGNGRVAFVVYNWVNHTLEDPVPLPEFEFS